MIHVRDLFLFGVACVVAFTLPMKKFEKLCALAVVTIGLCWGYRWLTS